MKFKHGTRRRAAEYEKDWVQRWKDDQTFEKSVAQRSADNAYVFYDGPPFITGVPHHGTLLSSIVKDAVPRYWTMKGKRVERRWGWDCHGLPAENFVEKQMNIVDRRQIVASSDQPAPLDKDGNPLPTISLEKYIIKARESMVANSETWQGVIDRIGRWVDFTGAYRTMDKDFMESVWWAFKQLYEAGKIYEGEKVLMYDTKFATPVSKAEVTMDNDAYQTVTDPSVYVKFKLPDEDVAVLAWTTTPWTLPANLMLAVNPEMTYCEVLVGGEKLIIAEEALERTLQDEKHQPLDYKVLRKFPGSELVGKTYQSLDTGSAWPDNDKIHTIYAADFVSHESGTGIVHIAPAYGEDDFELAKRHGISAFHVIDDNGYYTDGNYKGLEVWDNNKFIAKDLKEKGAVWKIEYIRHEYPFNPRSKQRIMYRAIPSWFFDIQGQKPLMLEQNEHINWFPAHLKHGRFAKNIEQAPDWNLSRDRFWATAMPVWKGDRGTVRVVGSYAELKELSGVELDDYHRPWVDDITFEIDGETFTRIDKVLDCWFESGSMPFAQLHYPFENQAKFEQNYPADFIVEYIGQVRAWFYYVHAVNAALAEIGAFGEAGAQHKNAYSNVITTGVVAGNDGRKMSKSLGNFTDPNELMDKFSADSLRFLLLSSPLLNGEDFALHDKDVGDVARKLSMIWNMYDFFTMYAEVDGWEFDGELRDPLSDLTNPLDIWIVSRLHQLVAEVERHMDTYNIPDALSPILPFLDDASNWYVRRGRRRFWKSEDDGDKNDAYRTLHYVLVCLSYILAPFTPFLAEELYHNLTGDDESIHLKDWLPAGEINRAILRDMNALRVAVNDGLSKRAAAGIKVRQPLASAKLVSTISGNTTDEVRQFLVDVACDELNVKSVEVATDSELEVNESSVQPSVVYDFVITPELKREGLVREIIRHVQSARKKAGLQVDDRIELAIFSADTEITQAINTFAEVITAETLAVKLDSTVNDAEKYDVKIDDKMVAISLQKAK
ncbi:isoleucyl-tRNA synthase [Candidatus Nanosynbacter lyticus]|uniref:Isoleucine--tRNA ligase n=1 Tax=Candidatus Nanosynbacter lyticus TaxID=2093824 RepID=A0A6S4GTM4_9BACT|nr:isoleucine--tRNA ligase [Candidatus Nanosynbacter lyticus]AJA06347.1 isoleucyl-tRNA synthase [Candidatus Nanosynbacter lyticus]QCT41321.1 isoleucine--tRNA ligase [TM7 phylum sp. oral taxon 952]